VKSPHGVDDLRFASDLQPFDEQSPGLEAEGYYDRVLFAGRTFSDDEASADGARFIESAFSSAGLDGARLRRARLSDVWFGETRLVAVDLAEASLTDVWFSGCVFAGTQAYSCAGRRVLFRNCKLDSVNFRDSKLTDVVFEDCVLRDVDFGSARLTRVRFPASQLSNVDLTRVTCKDVDLRGARLGAADGGGPGIKAGYDALAGVWIDNLQLMTLAPLLAQQLGLIVRD
jgi:uncharacterized protein YjbI with pentapeptide repeats